MSRPSSGSWTARSASMTALSVMVGIGSSVPSRCRPGVLTVEASISYRAPSTGLDGLGGRSRARPDVGVSPDECRSEDDDALRILALVGPVDDVDSCLTRPDWRPYPRPDPPLPPRSATDRAHRRRQARGCGQEVRREPRRRPHRPGSPVGGVLHPARSLGLRQDHDPADDRRLRGADVRAHRAQGRGRHVAAALQAPRQHRLPELRALPAPDDLRERRLRPAPFEGRRRRGQDPRHRDAQARRAARLRGSQADPDLRRPGAARRARAGPHQPARRPAPRRAAGRPRPQAAQADAGRAQAHPAGSRASPSSS